MNERPVPIKNHKRGSIMKKMLISVIASPEGTKQSLRLDCFVATLLAMTVCSPALAYDFAKKTVEEPEEKTAVSSTETVVTEYQAAVPEYQAPAPVEAPVKQEPPKAFFAKPLAAPKIAAVSVPETAAPPAQPEALQKFRAIQNQEEWVGKLKKQLEGEATQLDTMRKSMAQSFGLDAKKLETGKYRFDEKSGKFIDK